MSVRQQLIINQQQHHHHLLITLTTTINKQINAFLDLANTTTIKLKSEKLTRARHMLPGKIFFSINWSLLINQWFISKYPRLIRRILKLFWIKLRKIVSFKKVSIKWWNYAHQLQPIVNNRIIIINPMRIKKINSNNNN